MPPGTKLSAVSPRTKGGEGGVPAELLAVDAIEMRPVADLIPYASNARTHSDRQVAQIAASIMQFGFVNPILIGDDGVIVAGHGRLLAAQELGMTQVPVIVLGHLTPAQRRAYLLADNKLAMNAGWDNTLLKLELGALGDLGFDLSVIGFTLPELGKLGIGGVDSEADDAPEVPVVPLTQPGDLWTCGDHRVLCGSATVLPDVERVMAGEAAGLCFTDPPYNVDYGNTGDNPRWGKHRPIMNDALGTGFAAFLFATCTNIIAVTNGAIYICMSCQEIDVLQKAFRDAGGKWSTFIIWAKNTFSLGRSDYQRQYEPILYGWKNGGDHYWCGARDQGDVWFIDKPHLNELHPTMKPVALVERALANSSNSGDIVFDPFGGSGTTMIAAERLGRRARLIELDPKYVDVIVRRWEEQTGKTAHRHDGATLASLSCYDPVAKE